MADLTLNRKDTALFISMRTIEVPSEHGNFFDWAVLDTAKLTDGEYEDMVSNYLAWEDKADADELKGTDIDNAVFDFETFEETYPERPSRPNPLIHRPHA